MENMQEMKDKWQDIMEDKMEVENMMKDMPTEGMDEMKAEWDKMTESMNKIDGMIKGM